MENGNRLLVYYVLQSLSMVEHLDISNDGRTVIILLYVAQYVDHLSAVRTIGCSEAGFTLEWNFTAAFVVDDSQSIEVTSVLVCDNMQVSNPA